MPPSSSVYFVVVSGATGRCIGVLSFIVAAALGACAVAGWVAWLCSFGLDAVHAAMIMPTNENNTAAFIAY